MTVFASYEELYRRYINLHDEDLKCINVKQREEYCLELFFKRHYEIITKCKATYEGENTVITLWDSRLPDGIVVYSRQLNIYSLEFQRMIGPSLDAAALKYKLAIALKELG